MLDPLSELTKLPQQELAAKGIEHTPREIQSQPKVWIRNFEILRSRKDEIRSFIESRVLRKNMPSVILSGAGSSGFVGLSAQGLLRKRWQVDVESRHSTDIVTNWDSIFLKNADTTLVSFARSGNSPESIGAFVLANRFCKSVNHIIVTCNKAGRLARMKNENVLLLLLSEEANDKGLAMTASFTTMLMTAQFLAHILNGEEYEPIIRDLSQATETLFKEYSSLIKEVSMLDFERAFFLGNGALYGCAVESHLKLQELTAGQVISKYDSFLGLRHGPEAATDDRALVVYFVSTDPFVRRYELDLMKDLHAKGLGMKKIAVCSNSNEEMEGCIDYAIEFDRDDQFDIPDLCRPVMDVTVGQMLGLFKSLDLNLKPDSPSEKGIISRVVKGVKVYDCKKYKDENRFEVLAE